MENIFKQTDEVLSCIYIERGLSFQPQGITCCCMSTFISPTLVTADEINAENISYEIIIKRRKELFKALNGKCDADTGMCPNCASLKKVLYKDVCFDYFGNVPSINIQHYTACNLRCSYCSIAQSNSFYPEQYSTNSIISIIESFQSRGKLLKGQNCGFSGGEPTLLESCDKFVDYYVDNEVGPLTIFSNATKFSDSIFNRLKENSIFLFTSIDAGLPTTFSKIRGVNAMYRVVDTLIKYRKSNTRHLLNKYIINLDNIDDDNLFAFVFLMVAIRPNSVCIAVDFPHGDKEIPNDFAIFGARLWYYLKKYGNFHVTYYHDIASAADTKFSDFYKNLSAEFDKLVSENPLTNEFNLLEEFNQQQEIINSLQNKDAEFLLKESTSVQCRNLMLSKQRRFVLSEVVSSVEVIVKAIFKTKYKMIFQIENSCLFDKAFYAIKNPDVENKKHNPVEHYVLHGAEEGRDPAPWFSTVNYLNNNPDVRESNMNPFFHYIMYGFKEGRRI